MDHRIALLDITESCKKERHCHIKFKVQDDRQQMTDTHTNITCTVNNNSLGNSTAMDIFADIRIDEKFSKILEEADISFLELKCLFFIRMYERQ